LIRDRALAEAQNQVGQMQSEFASQLSELQAEKDSLIFDLEQSTKEVNDLKSIEVTLRARIAALESELEAAKGKPSSPLIHAKPLLSQVDISRIEPEVLLSEQEHKKPVVEETEQEVESSIKTTAVQSDEQEQSEIEVKEPVPVIAETSSSVPAEVTAEEVNAADFDSATEKVIFIKALSEISSQYKAIRVDAVKTIAGIDHELSVRALIGQIAKEPVPQVRAECIKALAELNRKEGLPAIERALTEEALSVRLAAVRGLYRLGGLTSAPQLLRMLCDENKEVRRRTATCIGWLGREDLAVELVPLLDDSSASVRRAAIEAMGNLHSQKVVEELIVHLTDPEKMIRKVIIAALKTITGKKMSGPFPGNEKSVLRLVARWQQWWGDPASQI